MAMLKDNPAAAEPIKKVVNLTDIAWLQPNFV